MRRQTASHIPDRPRPRSRWLLLPPAMRFPEFRAYWLGMLASVGGFQIFLFVQVWLAYSLTGSSLSMGFVGLSNAVPAILLNLYGGVFADRLDKRRLLVVTKAISGLLLILLATLVLLGAIQFWHLLVISFLTGAVNAFDQPASQALFPQLIDRRAMISAVALNGLVWQSTRIVAPAVAGIIIVLVGVATSIYVAGGGFLVMVMVLIRLHAPPVRRERSSGTAHDMLEGVRFIKGNSVFSFLIAMTFFNSFFGMSYVWLMPIFALDILDVGAQGQGFLLSMTGLGGLSISLFLSAMGKFPRPRLVLVGGAVATGLSLAAFAITSELIGSFPLAMGLMLVVGFSSSAYMVAIRSSLQLLVPDHMRGRVMGFHGMTWSITPLGALQAGVVAHFIGAPAAIAIGGFAVVAFAVGPALLSARVRNLDAELRQAQLVS